MAEGEPARGCQQREAVPGRGHKEEVVAAIARLVVGGETKQGRVAGAGGDDGVVIEVERPFAVDGGVAAVAAVMDDPAVAGAVGLEEQVPIDVSPRILTS